MVNPPIILVVAASYQHFRVWFHTEYPRRAYDPRIFRYISDPEQIWTFGPEHSRMVIVEGDLEITGSLYEHIKHYQFKCRMALISGCENMKHIGARQASDYSIHRFFGGVYGLRKG